MKLNSSKTEAKDKIEKFFSKESFTSEEAKKIRRLAMKYSIRLGENRKLFCKHCFNKLKGKTRINKGYKTVVCDNCKNKSRFKID